MAARVSEDAKKFVVLLASRLKKDNIQINDDAESYLRTAISSLPETPLKSALQKQHNAYLKTFISLIGIKSTKEKNKVDDQTETAKIFNLFGKHGLDRAICKLLHQDIDDTCLRSCYPLIQDSEKLLSVLKADETDTDKCMAMTSGHNTAKSVCESLDFIVRRMSEKCEQYLQEPVHKKRASALKDCIFKTVAEGYVSTKRQTYEDYMAALFSLYIDLVLVCMTSSEEEVHQSNKHLASVVLLVLGRSPVHLMDTCLQLSNLNGDNINHLTPFLRCVLERNKGNLTHTDYIKFVCLAHMVLQIGSTPEPGTCIALNEVVKSQVPPPKFVSWLNQRNRSLVEKLCLSRKMTSSHVTKHLIDKMSEEDKEHLLDVASESEMKEDQNDDHATEEEKDQGITGEQPLFFIDSAGDGENNEPKEIEYEEYEGEEKILQKQLRSLITRIERDSESEEEFYMDTADDSVFAKPSEPLFVVDTKLGELKDEMDDGNEAPKDNLTEKSVEVSDVSREIGKQKKPKTRPPAKTAAGRPEEMDALSDEVNKRTNAEATKTRGKSKSVKTKLASGSENESAVPLFEISTKPDMRMVQEVGLDGDDWEGALDNQTGDTVPSDNKTSKAKKITVKPKGKRKSMLAKSKDVKNAEEASRNDEDDTKTGNVSEDLIKQAKPTSKTRKKRASLSAKVTNFEKTVNVDVESQSSERELPRVDEDLPVNQEDVPQDDHQIVTMDTVTMETPIKRMRRTRRDTDGSTVSVDSVSGLRRSTRNRNK
ncbi:uncharacterized protein LOC5516556 isoform X2 [Nematostella vectensis]|uniref:uncharacterized protein LOC5516556 isoform X2 n=1 Tax=Nematostella vectensis TaxID=45351 RepID=UPI0020772A93|nr:uncharacterized protein LOC5516556 isoform X2 [Nematostella vectensis]